MKMIAFIFSIFLFSSFSKLKEEPTKITWEDLADVEYEEVYLEEFDVWYWKPIFGNEILKLENNLIEIEGNYEVIEDTLAYVSFGNSQMPHEIIQLSSSKRQIDLEPARVNIIGILYLHSDNPYKMHYNLDVQEIKEVE